MGRRASPWPPPPVSLAVIVALVVVLARADELTDRVDASVCLVSKRPPSVVRRAQGGGLTLTRAGRWQPAGKMVFCPTSGAETSCCLPFHDARLAEAFEAMTDTGLGCLQSSLRPDARYNALHSFLCASCAPDQVKDRVRARALTHRRTDD